VLNAIDREKELKKWPRAAKNELITATNPALLFYNSDVLGNWPPTESQISVVKERWKTEGTDGRLSFCGRYNSQVSLDTFFSSF
jgi:hypothetical protein